MVWKKIGKVSRLMIYPIKSSVEGMRCDSCAFFDSGICDRNGYLFDGTKDKFEDTRTYPLLQHMRVNLTGFEVTLNGKGMNSTVKLDIKSCHINDDIENFFIIKNIWDGHLRLFCSSNKQVNTWVKEMIGATQTDDDIILTQMITSKQLSMHKIKQNWSRFVQGYETMEDDKTGELITLPRIVSMTSQAHKKLITRNDVNVAPNIIIDTDESMYPFEVKYLNWNLIKIGNSVILKKVKAVPRGHPSEEYQLRGIYYGLMSTGIAKEGDDVFIDYSG